MVLSSKWIHKMTHKSNIFACWLKVNFHCHNFFFYQKFTLDKIYKDEIQIFIYFKNEYLPRLYYLNIFYDKNSHGQRYLKFLRDFWNKIINWKGGRTKHINSLDLYCIILSYKFESLILNRSILKIFQ